MHGHWAKMTARLIWINDSIGELWVLFQPEGVLLGKCRVIGEIPVKAGDLRQGNYQISLMWSALIHTRVSVDAMSRIPPPGGGRLTPVRAGNPGKDLGVRPISFKIGGWVRTGNFRVIQAIEGTWLSAAARKYGWGAVYGPREGYGAYIEGIVRREDGTPIWGADADKIRPGEYFAIAIYEGGSEGPRAKRDKLELTPEQQGRIKIRGPSVGLAEAVGLSQEIVGQLLEPVGVVLAFAAIPMQMADLGRGPHPPMAVARAHCYAKTAFAWMEQGEKPLPVSSVFHYLRDSPIVPHQELFPVVQKAWEESWRETIRKLEEQFNEARTKIYMEVSRRNGNTRPLSLSALRRFAKDSLQSEFQTAAAYCDKCLASVGDANWWKNFFPPTVKPLWDLQRKTSYPD